MSLWTPGGEHPVDRGGDGGQSPSAAPGPPGAPPAGPEAQPGGQRLTAEQEAQAQEMAAEMQQVRDQLGQVPAAQVVANHAMGCWELAAIHLSAQPPNFAEAQIAIDAFGALVEVVRGRLGEDEGTLTDALAQLRLAFVQMKASVDEDPSASGPGTTGASEKASDGE